MSSKTFPKRLIDPVDKWLQNEGFYRICMPKDPTCLFRAVSKYIFKKPSAHGKIRSECIEFMKKNRDLFEKRISEPFQNYVDRMASFSEWGGNIEILAISLLYKKNVIIFNSHQFNKNIVADHGFSENIYLCFTPLKQYDIVYINKFHNGGHKSNSSSYSVNRTLDEPIERLKHNVFFQKENIGRRKMLEVELYDEFKKIQDEENELGRSDELEKMIDNTNTKFDDDAIDQFHNKNVQKMQTTNSSNFQLGSKCLVQIDNDDKCSITTRTINLNERSGEDQFPPSFYPGYIQELSDGDGSAVVFIEGLGIKKSVPFAALKPFPQAKKWNRPRKFIFHINNEHNKNKTNFSKQTTKNEWTSKKYLNKKNFKELDEENKDADQIENSLQNTHISSENQVTLKRPDPSSINASAEEVAIDVNNNNAVDSKNKFRSNRNYYQTKKKIQNESNFNETSFSSSNGLARAEFKNEQKFGATQKWINDVPEPISTESSNQNSMHQNEIPPRPYPQKSKGKESMFGRKQNVRRRPLTNQQPQTEAWKKKTSNHSPSIVMPQNKSTAQKFATNFEAREFRQEHYNFQQYQKKTINYYYDVKPGFQETMIPNETYHSTHQAPIPRTFPQEYSYAPSNFVPMVYPPAYPISYTAQPDTISEPYYLPSNTTSMQPPYNIIPTTTTYQGMNNYPAMYPQYVYQSSVFVNPTTDSGNAMYVPYSEQSYCYLYNSSQNFPNQYQT